MAIMLLREKIAKGFIQYGDYIYNFNPDFAECTLIPEETGKEEAQILRTEDDMKWILVRIDGQLALLADATTEQAILLKGKIGYEKGVGAFKKYAQTCWSSKRFRATGISTKKEQFDQLPEIIRKSVKDEYWLGSTYIHRKGNFTVFGMRKANDRSSEYGFPLIDSHSYANEHSCHFRPVVLLPSDIKIDDYNSLVPFDDTKEGTIAENSSVPSGLVSLGTEEDKMLVQAQKIDAKEQLKSMIVEQEKKLAEQQEMLEKMKALLSNL